MSYIMYLRKSRADIEAEQHGEMETLARHEAALTEYAKKNNLEVTKTYKEIVSGDSIQERPMMQQLLKDISTGYYDGVLVMEIERLARGNTIDQGIVAQSFKATSTLIVTPHKTYNPSNEFDETFLEFNLFMSRQEYKTIKRRLMAGRIASAKEGNYAGSNDPYGYKRVHTHKNTTLEIVPEEAEIVRQMYEMYVDGNLGFMQISRILREQGKVDFPACKIKDIIHRELYKGCVTFGKQRQIEVVDEDGRKHREWHRQKDYLVCKGKHEAIVSEELWQRAQDIADKRWHASKSKDIPIRNRLQGLIRCSKCGHVLRLKSSQQKKYNKIYYYYECAHCDTKQIQEHVLLSIVNGMIREHYEKLKCGIAEGESNLAEMIAQGDKISKAKSELKQLATQKDKICEAYERGTYDDETYERRMSAIKKKEEALTEIVNAPRIKYVSHDAMIVRFEQFLSVLDNCENHEAANELYKTIVDRIDYTKESGKDPIISITYAV